MPEFLPSVRAFKTAPISWSFPMSLSFAGWRLDPGARTAQKHGKTERLSPRAMRFIEAFAEAPGATLSRAELLTRIWPDVFVGDESLTQVVSELRRKLGDRGLIETVARGGYRLSAPVLRAVSTPSPPPLRVPRPNVDLEAYTLCLEAQAELVRCGPGSIRRAERLTAEALDLAPDCPAVRADRAIALVRQHMYWSEGQDSLATAIAEAEKAVTMDPSCARARSALGYALCAGGHWRAAQSAHEQALAADPRDPGCYHYAGWLMMTCRRHRAAVAMFEQAGDLDGQNIKAYLQAARLSLEHDPQRARRNAERALKRAQDRLAIDPADPRALTATGVVLAMLGEPAAAFATIEQIDVQDSAQAIYHASTYAMIGEMDRALGCFECLCDHGWRDIHWLDGDPGFASIAGDRRFLRIRQRLAAA